METIICKFRFAFLLILFQSLFYTVSYGQTVTVNMSGTSDGTNIGANAFDGGSNNLIFEKNGFQFFGDHNNDGVASSSQIQYNKASSLGVGTEGGFFNIGTAYDAATRFVVKKTDGGEFDFQSVVVTEFSSFYTPLVIEGFKNGVSVGTQSINNTVSTQFTVLPNATFDDVDEVRFHSTGGFGEQYAYDNFVFVLAAANTAPVIGGTLAGQTVNDNATIKPFSGVTITDANGDNVTAIITLDTNAKGVLSGTDLSGTGPYTIASKTAANMQVAIRALTFNPTDNRTATSETTTFTININDGITSTNNNTTTVISSAVAPIVSSVNVPANATYIAGQNFNFTINFNEIVTVNTGGGTPQMSLTIGATTRQAVYLSGSGTAALLFRYTVQAGELDTDGITVGTLAANGGTLRDSGGKDANLTLNSVGSTANVNVDATAPTITSVTVPANATYIAGQNLDFTINFSENVTVNTGGGTPQMGLTIGATTRQAVYLSGSGTSSLSFRYTVQAGDLDTDGISIGTLAANGGTIRDNVTNNATLTLNSVGATTNVNVDAVAPTVTSVTVPANATYIAGQNLDFTINFSENVTVNTAGGTPQISLTIGSTTRQAVYVSGSGTSSLSFRYTVQAGDLDTDGIAIGTLAANGGTLRDNASNNANLTLNSVGSTTAVLVDAVAFSHVYSATNTARIASNITHTYNDISSCQTAISLRVISNDVIYNSAGGNATIKYNIIVNGTTISTGNVYGNTFDLSSYIPINSVQVASYYGGLGASISTVTFSSQLTVASPTTLMPVKGPNVANVFHCMNTSVTPLTAELSGTGTTLKWYTVSSGGMPNATAPTPNASSSGITSYWVSQTGTGGCESERSQIDVMVYLLPTTPTITAGGPTTFCTGGNVILTSSSASGNVWSTGATTQSISVSTGGTYTVAVTGERCTSVTSTGTNVIVNLTPAVPAVTTPITYNVGATATALTATGTGLLWYTEATGGTGTGTAPTLNTATSGTTFYWVSQSTATCEGPRARIDVNILPNATHLNFDGVDDYVNCGNSPTLNLTGSVTVESMIYRNSIGDDGCIVGKDNWSANTGYSFWVLPDNKFGLRFGNRVFSSTNVVPSNEYVHLSATYNLSTKTVSIFLNGVLDGTYSDVSNPVSNSGNLYLGTPQDAVGSSSYAFNGSIDEVRIWNRALSQAEIVNNMNCELPTPATQTGLLAYYQFNQGVDATDNSGVTSLADSSVTASNGTLTNFGLTGATSNWVAGSPIVTGTNCPYIVPTITVTDINKTYGDVNFDLAATSNSTGLISYSIIGANTTGTSLSGTDNKTVNVGSVGSLTIRATQAAEGSYASETKDITLTISKRAITITADAKSKIYGGVDPALAYQLTAGTLVSGDSFSGSLTRSAGENVANYAISAGTVSAGANYTMTFVPSNLSITARAITITADAKSKIYGSVDPALTYQLTTGALVSGDSFSGSLTRSAGENVANYAISAGTVSAGANYTMTFVPSILSITARAITITADAKSKVYGGVDPALTYQLTTGSLVSGDSFSGSLTRSAGENVANYAISVGTVSAGANYTMTFVPSNLSITARAITITADAKSKVYGGVDPALTYQLTAGALVSGDSFSGSLSRSAGENVGNYAISVGTVSAGANYTMTFVPSNLSITARAITITADAKSKVYGGVDPALTYQLTTGSLVSGDSFSGSLTRSAGENVANYAISVGTVSAGANYTMTFVPSNLSITARAITITADAKSKVYGGVDPSLTYQLTAGALVSGDSFSGSLTRSAGENVANYAISVGTVSAGANYTMTFVPSNLSITARAITITADAKSKVYGGVNPALTYQLTSGTLVSGDSFSGSLSRSAGENVGNYAISVGTVSAGANYMLTFVGNNFSIIKANQVIVWSQTLALGCDGKTTTVLTATSNSGLAVNYVSSDSNIATISGNVLSLKNYGSATVTATQSGDGNHNAALSIVFPLVNYQPNLLKKHFDNVIFFDNSSKEFVAYSWYKNGVLVPGQTAQYFKDSGVLNGTYFAKATKVDGMVVTTCDLTFSSSTIEVEFLKVAPNPVKSNSSYQIITNIDSVKLQNARVTVFNTLGTLMDDKIVSNKITDMIAPTTEGIYIVRLTLSNGKNFTKNLLVRN
ncbi:MBG domain-containing protein [Flavobacterium sp. K5-23]|uniref:MBG domain-containing protein n=1 Tax=Flavobacterium sp. K5-23 TaxID=2746225 RepID=UPI00200F3B36|nr:MBG domain-containing protein [Flavobacterium sp. K5-23]UQD56219.1 T9SS type A sorting domain-containing protein [Flavobacterium sp. K5-23]